jgi:hypothetical protein
MTRRTGLSDGQRRDAIQDNDLVFNRTAVQAAPTREPERRTIDGIDQMLRDNEAGTTWAGHRFISLSLLEERGAVPP